MYTKFVAYFNQLSSSYNKVSIKRIYLCFLVSGGILCSDQFSIRYKYFNIFSSAISAALIISLTLLYYCIEGTYSNVELLLHSNQMFIPACVMLLTQIVCYIHFSKTLSFLKNLDSERRRSKCIGYGHRTKSDKLRSKWFINRVQTFIFLYSAIRERI